MSEAEQILQAAAGKEQHYKDELLGARNEGYELIEGERAEALEERQEKVSKAKARIEKRKAKDLKDLTEQTEIIRGEIDDTVGKLADEISSNIFKAA